MAVDWSTITESLMLSIVSRSEPYQSGECSMRFWDRDRLVNHHRVSNLVLFPGQKPFQCGECSMRFWDRGGLVNHHSL